MALTFTQRLYMPMGSKAFRAYEVTHDGSTATANASDFELNNIETAVATPGTQVLSAGSTAYCDITTAHGTSIAFTALSSGATTNFWLIGT